MKPFNSAGTGTYQTTVFTLTPQQYSVSNSVSGLPAGTYNVGFCIGYLQGGTTYQKTGFVTGVVTTTNK